jgi:hypothetical protein
VINSDWDRGAFPNTSLSAGQVGIGFVEPAVGVVRLNQMRDGGFAIRLQLNHDFNRATHACQPSISGKTKVVIGLPGWSTTLTEQRIWIVSVPDSVIRQGLRWTGSLVRRRNRRYPESGWAAWRGERIGNNREEARRLLGHG